MKDFQQCYNFQYILNIKLLPALTELEQVRVHNLSGNLKEDIAEIAKSTADELKRELESAGLTMISFTVFNSRRPNLPDRWTSPGSVVNVQA